MRWKSSLFLAILVYHLCAESTFAEIQQSAQVASLPNVVTEDIQAGIEKHIEDQTRAGDGYFIIPFNNKNLKLKLVRVHTEYLATLSPNSHFACVDLASTEGDIYDVDFFLTGGPDNMSVTETMVHKVNGQPQYVWKQNPDKTWVRVPFEGAPPELLGVIKGSDEFTFLYQTEVPEIKDNARVWIPIPTSDDFQTVQVLSIDTPVEPEILVDKNHGNRILFMNLNPKHSNKIVALRYNVKRLEKSAYDSEIPNMEKYLKSEKFVPVNDLFKDIAQKVVAGKKGTLVQARALYDHVIEHMSYKKFGEGWGKGDSVFACNARKGNCTDFHSYYMSLSRAIGIPSRFAIGAAIPSERDEGRIDGYHCWTEFYADGKWWPVDISEADKCSPLETYFFGHHPANRIELTRGRDLIVEPGPASGAINFLAYPIIEVDGKEVKTKIIFSFSRKNAKKNPVPISLGRSFSDSPRRSE